MDLLLRKKYLLKCWGCLLLLNWIEAPVLFLLLKLLIKGRSKLQLATKSTNTRVKNRKQLLNSLIEKKKKCAINVPHIKPHLFSSRGEKFFKFIHSEKLSSSGI